MVRLMMIPVLALSVLLATVSRAAEADLTPGIYKDALGNSFEIKGWAGNLLFRTNQIFSIERVPGTFVPLSGAGKDGHWIANQNVTPWGYAGEVRFEVSRKGGEFYLSETRSGMEPILYTEAFKYQQGTGVAAESSHLHPDDSPLVAWTKETPLSRIHLGSVIIPVSKITIPADGETSWSAVSEDGFTETLKLTYTNRPETSDRPATLPAGTRLWVIGIESHRDRQSRVWTLGTNSGQRFKLEFSTGSPYVLTLGIFDKLTNNENLFWVGELTPVEIPAKPLPVPPPAGRTKEAEPFVNLSMPTVRATSDEKADPPFNSPEMDKFWYGNDTEYQMIRRWLANNSYKVVKVESKERVIFAYRKN